MDWLIHSLIHSLIPTSFSCIPPPLCPPFCRHLMGTSQRRKLLVLRVQRWPTCYCPWWDVFCSGDTSHVTQPCRAGQGAKDSMARRPRRPAPCGQGRQVGEGEVGPGVKSVRVVPEDVVSRQSIGLDPERVLRVWQVRVGWFSFDFFFFPFSPRIWAGYWWLRFALFRSF